jgi:hypothetical protein
MLIKFSIAYLQRPKASGPSITMGLPSFNLCATTTLLLLPFLISFLSQTGTEAAATYLYHVCPNTTTTFTANSTYQSNLNSLLASLTSNATSSTGFYNTTASVGNSVDTVYGLFLCRGDLSADACRDCATDATKDVVDRCPNEKVAVAWYDECMLRYSNQYIFSRMVTDPSIFMWNTRNISEQNRFDLLVRTTMNDLASGVSNVGSGAKKFGTKEANFTALQTLYTLVQCTANLSGSDCNSCLQIVIANLPGCCGGKEGARVLFPSCTVRFEVYPFYQSVATFPPPPGSVVAPVPPPPGPVTTPKGKFFPFRFFFLFGLGVDGKSLLPIKIAQHICTIQNIWCGICVLNTYSPHEYRPICLVLCMLSATNIIWVLSHIFCIMHVLCNLIVHDCAPITTRGKYWIQRS